MTGSSSPISSPSTIPCNSPINHLDADAKFQSVVIQFPSIRCVNRSCCGKNPEIDRHARTRCVRDLVEPVERAGAALTASTVSPLPRPARDCEARIGHLYRPDGLTWRHEMLDR